MVYFAWDAVSNLIKIGYSESPHFRVNKLQTGNPNPLFVLATMPGTEEAENSLHNQFDSLRHNREWFRPGSDLLWFIHSTAYGGNCAQSNEQCEIVCRPESQARTWLEEQFREKREWEARELMELAHENGISKSQFWDAALGLPIAKRPM